MLHIQCQGPCGQSAYLECELTADGKPCGRPDCAHLDPDDAFDVAVPSCGCCTADHHHGQAAICAGGHGACPTPDNCPVWLGMQPHLPDSFVRDTSAGPCPGGHCGKNVEGCAVCRPLRITVMPGSAHVRAVTGG